MRQFTGIVLPVARCSRHRSYQWGLMQSSCVREDQRLAQSARFLRRRKQQLPVPDFRGDLMRRPFAQKDSVSVVTSTGDWVATAAGQALAIGRAGEWTLSNQSDRCGATIPQIRPDPDLSRMLPQVRHATRIAATRHDIEALRPEELNHVWLTSREACFLLRVLRSSLLTSLT
ncbi:MAG: hypothetical protein JWN70_4226 [Planctomycetaceae bacterium]|nr:hypothetical protein [Planctomycetaceae bacterium]